MIEQQSIDLAIMKGQGDSLVHLSLPQALPWSGIQFLAQNETIELAKGVCHDVYIISGTLHENGCGHRAGSFLRRGTNCTFSAGVAGSLLFISRDVIDNECSPETIAGHDLVWFSGCPQGMKIACLAKSPHQLSLVLWQSGTRVHFHTHPLVEEILVLEGELRDEKGAYPAGCWLRFLPGTGHAPYAEKMTLIMLRNGHMQQCGT